MSFTESVRSVLSQYAVFSGRASRSEYWWYYLFTFLVGLVTSAVDGAVRSALDVAFSPVSLLVSLALLVPGLAVAVRRLHDSDLSGLWILGPLLISVAASVGAVVAVIVTIGGALGGDDRVSGAGLVILGIAVLLLVASAIWWIVLMVRQSTPGPNRFGPGPHDSAAPQAPGWGTPSEPPYPGQYPGSQPSSEA